MPNDLLRASDRLREWAIGQALPLWSGAGYDKNSGRFREALALDGQPRLDLPTRLIVQCRQIFSYALAARRGWQSGADGVVETAYRALVRDFYRPDGQPGWVYSVYTDGRVADSRRDLYSHAFALLAIGAYVQVTGRRDALNLADETLAFLDADLRAEYSGGYIEVLPKVAGHRRQNPHMHLFEAFLALWSSTGEGRFLARAGEMFGLFTARFFKADTGTLGEYFDERLQPAEGMAGEIVEPGHHSEWVWLLRWFEKESGHATQSYVDALYAHATTHGYDSAGLMVDEVLRDGTHRLPSHRVWPMTEAIKANVAEAIAGRIGAVKKATELADLLFERFFSAAFPGGWMDRLDGKGQPATDTMPASSLYHVMCSIDELDRFARSIDH